MMIANVRPEDVVEWGQHPLTKILIMTIGSIIASAFITVAVGIWAVVKWLHPTLKASVVKAAVSEAQEPFAEHISDAQEIISKYDRQFDALESAVAAHREHMAEMKSDVREIRDLTNDHTEMLGAINGKLEIMMNGHFKDRREKSRLLGGANHD